MQEKLFEKMKSLFYLIDHNYQEIDALELLIYQLARGNTFNMRVVGLDEILKLKANNPDCSITFKANHLSEADFIVLSILFREHNMKVLFEGGSNLFIKNLDVFQDVIPSFVNPAFKGSLASYKLSIAEYLSSRGSFKVFRKPQKIVDESGQKINLGQKEIISLIRTYRQKLLKDREMYVTFPGYSTQKSNILNFIKSEIKTGRSYTGKFDGFHHLPFLIDMEASLYTNVKLYFVTVNISYEPVIEDINFEKIEKLVQNGACQEAIYQEDLGYIIREFCRPKRVGNLSIKFSRPKLFDTNQFKGSFARIKLKKYAESFSNESYRQMLAMQTVFPSNIYFSGFNEKFDRISIQIMKARIDAIRDYLGKLQWSDQYTQLDLKYVSDYSGKIISADEIINKTFEIFATTEREVTGKDSDTFVIYNKAVAQQYKNHTLHFLADLPGF